MQERHDGYRSRRIGMSSKPEASRDLPRARMAALMLAVFVVSTGYGVVLPLLPYLIERLQGGGIQVAQVTRHTGLPAAVYALCRYLFSPLWGR